MSMATQKTVIGNGSFYFSPILADEALAQSFVAINSEKNEN